MLKLTQEHILSIASNKEVYQNGKDYKDNIIDITFENKSNYKTIHAQVKEVVEAAAFYRVYVLFEPIGQIVDYKCSCNANFVWRGACKHVVAVLLSLLEKESSNYEKNRAHHITNIFEGHLRKQIQQTSGTGVAAIRPTVIVSEEGRPALELAVGIDRFYVIKNIHAFLEDVRNEATVNYGKNLEFKHKISAFDANSLNLLEILITIDQLYTDAAHIVRARRHLGLPGKMFDEFFDLYAGLHLPVVLPDGKTENLHFCTENEEYFFTLKAEENSLTLSVNNPAERFDIIQGGHYNYIVWGANLCRIEKERADVIRTISEELVAPKITFSGEQYQRFLAYVIPVLKQHRLANLSFLKLPQAKIYLDYQKKHVVCTLEYANSYEESLLAEKLAVLNFVPNSKGEYILEAEEQIYNFYTQGINSLKQYYEVYATDTFKNKDVKKMGAKYYNVRLKGNLLQLELDSSYSPEELIEALLSFKLKKRYHRLNNGSFVNLEDETMRDYMEVLSAVDVGAFNITDGKITLPVYRSLLLDSLVHESAQYDSAFQKLIRDLTTKRVLKFSPPANLVNIMRPYQKTGLQWLKMLAHYGFGGVLADEMGLGKTLQIISLLLFDKQNNEQQQSLKQQSLQQQSLVVTPTSLVYNWASEIKRFAPELQTVVLAGLPSQRRAMLKTNADVFITTYDTLKRDISHYEGFNFKYVVADEAQYIKNPTTQNAKAIKTIQSQNRFALTGTPIENSISELWSIFDFVMPGFFGSLGWFTKHYTTPIIKYDDPKKAELLKKQTAPFILRRLKTDVLTELPDKMETNLYAQMHPEQRKIYTINLLKARGELDYYLSNLAEGENGQGKLKILAEITRLRQICCHPGLFIENYKGGSGKLDLAVEVILSAVASGHRILLFSQFTSMLAILKKTLDEERIGYFYLDGGTDARLRTSMAEKFNGGEKNVFLISLRAGGTGLNLTGADVVIHYDEWWNPAVMNQASDRAHRYGQKKVVQVIHLIVKDSIEEKIIALQERKKNLVDSVLQQGAHFINRMSMDDLRELLQEGR